MNPEAKRPLPKARHPEIEVEIREEPTTALDEYAQVSIAFEVDRVLETSAGGRATWSSWFERRLDEPYLKDYDQLAGNHPRDWVQRFDLSTWGLFSASIRGARVGGAVVAQGETAIPLLDGRPELAVLWDLRVSPDTRGAGIGSALLRAAEYWAVARGCRQLKVETQNINVVACRFYAGRGFELSAIDPRAYPELPEEVQFIWYKNL